MFFESNGRSFMIERSMYNPSIIWIGTTNDTVARRIIVRMTSKQKLIKTGDESYFFGDDGTVYFALSFFRKEPLSWLRNRIGLFPPKFSDKHIERLLENLSTKKEVV